MVLASSRNLFGATTSRIREASPVFLLPFFCALGLACDGSSDTVGEYADVDLQSPESLLNEGEAVDATDHSGSPWLTVASVRLNADVVDEYRISSDRTQYSVWRLSEEFGPQWSRTIESASGPGLLSEYLNATSPEQPVPHALLDEASDEEISRLTTHLDSRVFVDGSELVAPLALEEELAQVAATGSCDAEPATETRGTSCSYLTPKFGSGSWWWSKKRTGASFVETKYPYWESDEIEIALNNCSHKRSPHGSTSGVGTVKAKVYWRPGSTGGYTYYGQLVDYAGGLGSHMRAYTNGGGVRWKIRFSSAFDGATWGCGGHGNIHCAQTRHYKNLDNSRF